MYPLARNAMRKTRINTESSVLDIICFVIDSSLRPLALGAVMVQSIHRIRKEEENRK